MNVNIEVFDKEPIDNLVTCLNFKMDKVIFFGQKDTMTEEAKELTRQALSHICDVWDVDFIELSTKNMERVLSVLTDTVEKEKRQGGNCFFDLTGGAEMILVAMGMYAVTHNIPMHRYDIEENQLLILNPQAPRIDQCIPARPLQLTIDQRIYLQGGSVDYAMQKDTKQNLEDGEFLADIHALWAIAQQDMRKWNACSALLKSCKATQSASQREILDKAKLKKSIIQQGVFQSYEDFANYLRELSYIRILHNLTVDPTQLSFQYKSPRIRNCLLEAGCLLELHTYLDRLNSGMYTDCRIGIHLKWGNDAGDQGYAIRNEIDVLLLNGYVLTFISCKGGSVDQMALYELDTVATRFGGKYAKKELVTACPLEWHHQRRAEEMGILVV